MRCDLEAIGGAMEDFVADIGKVVILHIAHSHKVRGEV